MLLMRCARACSAACNAFEFGCKCACESFRGVEGNKWMIRDLRRRAMAIIVAMLLLERDISESCESERLNEAERSRRSNFFGASSFTEVVEFMADWVPRKILHRLLIRLLDFTDAPEESVIFAFSDQKRVAGARTAAATRYGRAKVVTRMALLRIALSEILPGKKFNRASNGLCPGSAGGSDNARLALLCLRMLKRLLDDLDVCGRSADKFGCEDNGDIGVLVDEGNTTL